jgi:predicted TPR repeat methyltransferase
MLDLGCGTGLVGMELAPIVGALDGVDLSALMLAKAAERGIYRRLLHGELLAVMEAQAPASYELITAADVFIYTGKLDGVFAEAARLLSAGGYFSFSTEALEAGEADYQILPSARYAHSRDYLLRLASENGLEVAELHHLPTRLERGQVIHAWLMLCRKG